MVKLRLINDQDLLQDSLKHFNYWEREYEVYSDKCFMRHLERFGDPDEPNPPFRDRESMMFFKSCEVSLRDEDWYGYESEDGRKCMSYFSIWVKYVLVVIANSKRGVYTVYMDNYDEVWEHLKEIPMEFLIAYNVDSDNSWSKLPNCLIGCVVEKLQYKNMQYENVTYEERFEKRGRGIESYIDESGMLHFFGDLSRYYFPWDQISVDVLKELEKGFVDVWGDAWVQIKMNPVRITDFKELFSDNGESISKERDIYSASDSFEFKSIFREPRLVYFAQKVDEICTIEDRCAGKYPTWYSAIFRMIEAWDETNKEALGIVIDIDIIKRLKDLQASKLWLFRDDGRTLTIFSGLSALKEYEKFVDDIQKNGKKIVVIDDPIYRL